VHREVVWSNAPVPLNGTFYYRIRQTDLDGTSSLEEVATITFVRNGTLTVSGIAEDPGLNENGGVAGQRKRGDESPRYGRRPSGPGLAVDEDDGLKPTTTQGAPSGLGGVCINDKSQV